jgi:hypothetical protein
MYTSEEIEIGKYYSKGTIWFCKLLEKTERWIEIYPGKFSRIYIFEVICLSHTEISLTTKELELNPNFQCFSEVDMEIVEQFLENTKKSLEIINILKTK